MTAPTSTATLADFLRARWNDDEQRARRAGNLRMYIELGPRGRRGYLHDDATGRHVELHPNMLQTDVDAAWLDHAAQHLPGRELARIDSYRRILDHVGDTVPHYRDPLREWESCPKVRPADFCEGTDLAYGPDAPCECAADAMNAAGGSPILRMLAIPYGDHPDCRPEWLP